MSWALLLVLELLTWTCDVMTLCVSVCLSVAAVNQAVKENRVNQTLRVLTLPEVRLQGLVHACAADYHRELYSLISDRTHRGTDHMI